MRIEDSTGKFIEVTGGEASKVLEGLINSIKGATNNTARIGNDKVSEKLEELTKTTAKDAKKLKKAIEDLPEEFAKSFTKEVGKIGDWIEEIRDFMKEMAKKRGKKASGLTGMEQLGSSVKKNPFKKDLQPLEKLMEGIQTATEKTERIFGKKGSGYTHDIYCQQELQKANGFLAEILNALTKGRRSGPPPVPRRTPPPLPGNGMTPNAAVGLTPGANGGLTPAGDNGRQLQIDLDDVVADLGEANKLSQELADYLARTHRHSRYWAQDLNEIAEKGAQIAISMDKSGEAEEKIIKKHERQAEILTKASEMWNDLLMKDKIRIKNMIRGIAKLKEQGATAEAVNEQYRKMLEETQKIVRNHHLLWGSLKRIQEGMVKIVGHGSAITAGFMGLRFLHGMVEGLNEGITQLVKDAGNLRALMIDKAWKMPGEYFNQLLQVSTELIDQIGQAPVTIRRAWLTNLKKGVRSFEDMKESLNAGLALSTIIGSNAEATADEFQKWNMHLGMSGKASANLARSIRMASASTGVMGDEMLKAVSAARELAQEMNNAGLDSNKIADNVIRMTASSQKFGVERQINELMRAASSLDQFTSASGEMKNLIALAGQGGRVISGEGMNTAANQRQTMMAVADMLKDEFGRMGALNSSGEIDTTKLSPQQITQMDLILRRKYGKNVGIGEAQRMEQAIRDANQTVEEKIAKLNEQMKSNNNLTAGEKKAMEAQLKILQEQKKMERNTAIVNALNAVSEEAKKKDSTLESMQKVLDEQAKAAQGRGINISTDMAKLTKEGIDSINERLKQAGQKELDRDKLMSKFNRGSRKDQREIWNTLSEADTKATTLIKKNGNIMDKAEQSQFKMQARLQKWLGKAVQFLGFLPVSVLYLSAIASSVTAMKLSLSDIRRFTQPLSIKGSAYVHDIHVEKLLNKLLGFFGIKSKASHHAITGSGATPPPLPSSGLKGRIEKAMKKAVENPIVKSISGMVSKVQGALGMSGGGLGTFGKIGVAFGAAGVAFGAIAGLFSMLLQHSEKLQKVVEPMTEMFGKFLGSMGDLIAPLVERFMPLFESHLKNLVPMQGMMVDLLGSLATIFIDLYKTIGPVMQIMNELTFGVIKVLFKLLQPTLTALGFVLKIVLFPLQMTIKALDLLVKGIEYLLTPLDWMSEAINWVSEQFNGLTDVFKGDFTENLSWIKDLFKDMGAILKEKLMPYVQRVVDTFNYLKKRFYAIYAMIKQKFAPIIERLQKLFAATQQRIEGFRDFILRNFGKALDRIIEGVTTLAYPLIKVGTFIYEHLVPSMNMLEVVLENILAPLEAFIGMIEKVSSTINRVNPMSKGGFLDTVTSGSPIKAVGNLLGFSDGGIIKKTGVSSEPVPIVAHAGEAILNQQQQGVVTKALMSPNNNDLEEQIQQRIQNSRPPAAMAAANEELVRIAANSEALVQLTIEQKDLLNAILNKLDIGKSQNNEGSTMLNTKPRATPNYYTWQQGRYGDGPTKQYVNPGT